MECKLMQLSWRIRAHVEGVMLRFSAPVAAAPLANPSQPS